MKNEKINYDIDDSMGMLVDWTAQFMSLQLNRKFKAAGHRISVEQWKILVTLWDEDGLTQQDLADRTEKNKVSVVKLIDGLEQRGLVVRTRDPLSRRSNRIRLTDKGREIQEELIRLANTNLQEASENIDPAEMAVCKKVLKAIIANMKG